MDLADARFPWPAVLALAGGMLLAACSSEPGNPGRAHGAADAVPVTIGTVAARDVPIDLPAIGRVEPYSTVALKSQVEGQLATVHFQEGQWVTAGDLLFTVDPRPFEAAVRQAEALLARDLAEAKNAEVDATRKARLFAQRSISQDENDQAQTHAAALRAAVQADEAAVDTAKLQLQYCYIRSPLDGRAGQILVHAGNVVKKNETTLAVINQVRPIYVAFSLPEQELPAIRRRAAAQQLPVHATIEPQGGEPHGGEPAVGELSFVNNTVDSTTGTVLLKGLFANTDERLWPGQFVDVALTLDTQRQAIVVPAEALQTGQQGPYVFVVNADSTVTVRPVVVGRTLGQEAIIAQGLAPGERVVTDGQIRLADGMKVESKNGAADTTPAPETARGREHA